MAPSRRCWGIAATLLGAATCLRQQNAFLVSAPAGHEVTLRGTQLNAAADSSSSLVTGLAAEERFRTPVSRKSSESGGGIQVDLSGKIAVVTGASRGIGEAIANSLAAAGATVIGTATSDGGAEAISARFSGDLKGKGMKLDVSDADDIKAFMKAVTTEFGAPDILVNNAGITKDTLMLRMKEKDWASVMDTNLNSIFRMTSASLKGMTKKRWGRVISITSVVASLGNAGQANYAASKAGAEGFTRSLAKEVASRQITINSIAPGFIQTDMTDSLKQEWKDMLTKQIPANRFGQPQDIADSVLFLCSDSASYVTGQTLHVNGGMYMQ